MDSETNTGLELDIRDTIDDCNKAEWNNVVDHADQGSFFHRYEWLDAVETGLGRQPKHLTINRDDNLIALYPNFESELHQTPFKELVSLEPGFGGPIATTDRPKCVSLFCERIPEICTGRTIVHRIRAKEQMYLGYNNLLKTYGYRPTRDGCRFHLSLTEDYEEIINRMRRDRRRNIHEGREQDYEIVEEELTRSNIRQFHEAYTRVMDRLGGSAFPLSFLTQLRHMESEVLLLTLRINGEYAGGLIGLLNEPDSYIHGWLLAVPEEYFENQASELLYHGVIQWGIDNGYDIYDMGYTSSDVTNGLFQYKKSYGGEIVPNLSWERGCSPAWPVVKTGRDLYWSRIKSPPV